MTESRARLVVAIFGVLVVAAYAVAHSSDLTGPDLARLSAPPPGKLLLCAASLAGLLVFDLCAWGLGNALLRLVPLSRAEASEQALLRLAAGFAVLPCAVLLLAALQALVVPAFAVLLLTPALLGAPSLWRAARSRSWGAGAPLWVGLLAIVAIPPLLAALSAEPGWDALTYHLALPERYLHHGGIVVTPFLWQSAFPLHVEMLYLLALGVGTEALAGLLHFQFGVLAAWAVYLLVRRFSPRAAGLAVVFLVANPLFLKEMGWTYNELAVSFYAAAAFIALADAESERSWQQLVWCGLFAGVCLASRYTGGAVLLALCIAVWWTRPMHGRANLRSCLWIGGAATLVMLPWLIRNLVFIGNPVSPVLQGLFHAPGSEYFHPITIEQANRFTAEIGRGRGLGALLASPWNVTMMTDTLTYRGFGYPIGPLHLVAVVAALCVASVRRSAAIAIQLRFALILFAIWLLTFQETRYLSALFPATAVVGGVAFDAILPERRDASSWVLGLVMGVGLLFAVGTTWGELGDHYALALGDASEVERFELDPGRAAAAELRAMLGPGDRVLLFYESRGYLFRGLDYIPFTIAEASPVLQLVHEAGSPEALRCRLAELAVSHVLVNRMILRRVKKVYVDGYGPEDLTADVAVFRGMMQRWGTRIWSRGGVAVAVLRPAPASCNR